MRTQEKDKWGGEARQLRLGEESGVYCTTREQRYPIVLIIERWRWWVMILGLAMVMSWELSVAKKGVTIPAETFCRNQGYGVLCSLSIISFSTNEKSICFSKCRH